METFGPSLCSSMWRPNREYPKTTEERSRPCSDPKTDRPNVLIDPDPTLSE